MNGFEDYQELSHTADIGFKVWGKTLAELFANAAKALTNNLVELKQVSPQKTISVHLKEDTQEELLVKWLEEILFLFETQSFIGLKFDIKKCDGKECVADIQCAEWDEEKMPLKTQIKAVTFHEMKILQREGQLEVQVILDV